MIPKKNVRQRGKLKDYKLIHSKSNTLFIVYAVAVRSISNKIVAKVTSSIHSSCIMNH